MSDREFPSVIDRDGEDTEKEGTKKERSPPEEVKAWASEFLSHLVDVRGFSVETAKSYGKALRDFDRRMRLSNHAAVTTQDLDRYAGRLTLAGLKENTRRSRLAALRSYFDFLLTRGFRPDNPARDVHPPRLRIVERIPTFTTAEIERLIFTFQPRAPGRGRKEPEVLFSKRKRLHELATARDTALLALIYQVGLRASEPGHLERRDYTEENRVPVLVLRESKRSTAPVSLRIDRRVAVLVDVYLRELGRAGVLHPALFPPLARRGPLTGRGIGPDEVAAILRRRVAAAAIEAKGRRLSPHTLRYSIATHLYEGGLRAEEIQPLMRHGSVETTWRYIRLGSIASIQRKSIRALFWNARRLPTGRGSSTPVAE